MWDWGGKHIYSYAYRLDPGQQPSNLAAGLRSNLFATQSMFSIKNKQKFMVFNSSPHLKYIFRKSPSIQKVEHKTFCTGNESGTTVQAPRQTYFEN